jgi:hypothetical protein
MGMIWFSITILGLLLALLIVSRKRKASKLKLTTSELETAMLKQRVGQIEQLAQRWQKISGNPVVLHELYQAALDTVQRTQALEENPQFALDEQQRLQSLLHELPAYPRSQTSRTAMSSSSEAGKVRNELKEIKRILKARRLNHHLSSQLHQQLQQQVDWLGSRVMLDTWIAMADEASSKRQYLEAAQLLQRAALRIQAGGFDDPRMVDYFSTINRQLEQLPDRASTLH